MAWTRVSRRESKLAPPPARSCSAVTCAAVSRMRVFAQALYSYMVRTASAIMMSAPVQLGSQQPVRAQQDPPRLSLGRGDRDRPVQPLEIRRPGLEAHDGPEEVLRGSTSSPRPRASNTSAGP